MAKNAKIGDLIFASVGLREEDLGVLTDIARRFGGENGPDWRKLVTDAVGGGLTQIAVAVKQLFEDMPPVTVVINKKINIKKALATQNSNRLWIDSSFGQILNLAGLAPEAVTMKPRKLLEDANDIKIKENLPKVHELETTGFCHMLATEIDKVMSEQPSEVLSKDRWCLFYVAGFAVRVRWRSGPPQWYVRVWGLGGSAWPHGGVVFSCN